MNVTKEYRSNLGLGVVVLRWNGKSYDLLRYGKVCGVVSLALLERLQGGNYPIARALDETLSERDPVARLTEIAELAETGRFAAGFLQGKKEAPLTTRQKQLLDYLVDHAELTAGVAQKILGLQNRMAAFRELTKLVERGELQRTGETRGARYLLRNSLTRDAATRQAGVEYQALLGMIAKADLREIELTDLSEFIYTNNKLEGVVITFGETQTAVRSHFKKIIALYIIRSEDVFLV